MNELSEPEIDTLSLRVPYSPSARDLCTPMLQRFLRRHFDIFDFFFFQLSLANRADEARLVAARALAALGEQTDVEKLSELEENPSPAMDRLIHFAQLQAENVCIRTVDNFLSFLSEIIQDAMIRKPEMLRGEDPVTLEDVLRFKRYSDLIPYLVDKKLNSLTYGGIQGIEKFVRSRTNLELFETPEQKTLLMLAVELRNNYSHNRGQVTEATIRRLKGLDHDFELTCGESQKVAYDDVIELSNNMAAVARRLDVLFARKFSIRRKRFRPRARTKAEIAEAVAFAAERAERRRAR